MKVRRRKSPHLQPSSSEPDFCSTPSACEIGGARVSEKIGRASTQSIANPVDFLGWEKAWRVLHHAWRAPSVSPKVLLSAWDGGGA